jgi:hypothetical protein
VPTTSAPTTVPTIAPTTTLTSVPLFVCPASSVMSLVFLSSLFMLLFPIS